MVSLAALQAMRLMALKRQQQRQAPLLAGLAGSEPKTWRVIDSQGQKHNAPT
jgi:hypothetical protein